MALAGWANSIKLTIDNTNVDSDLNDFPVLIKLDATAGQNNFDATPVFSILQSDSNRKKIAVTDVNDNQLYVEIERWSHVDQEAILWVKVPTVYAAVSTTLYLYYDVTQSNNTTYVGDTTESAAQNVWDSNFKGVWHMTQDPSIGGACIKDSTSYTYHGTPHGSMTDTDLVDGKIGKGLAFDGSNDYIGIAGSLIAGLSTCTIEVTVKWVGTQDAGSYGIDGAIIGRQHDGYYTNCEFGLSSTNPAVAKLEWAPFSWSGRYTASTVVGDNVWRHVAVQIFPTGQKMFVDGNQDWSIGSSGTFHSSTTIDFTIGAAAYQLASYSKGVICEVRVSTYQRTAAWLKATYYSNWNDLVSFEWGTILGIPQGNIFSNDYFIFQTMSNGVWVYDSASETLLSGISYPFYANSVWANYSYLYIGTTNSGILRSPISSISGGIYNDLDAYKSYPYILDDNVNYLHGAGNYLCIATISGINQFDLTTNSGIYSDTSYVAEKCFQTLDGGFYGIYNDTIVTTYSDYSKFSYVAGDGVVPSGLNINDIYVSETTPKVIYLATTNGVVLIEEDKGNELNCRTKYYILEE